MTYDGNCQNFLANNSEQLQSKLTIKSLISQGKFLFVGFNNGTLGLIEFENITLPSPFKSKFILSETPINKIVKNTEFIIVIYSDRITAFDILKLNILCHPVTINYPQLHDASIYNSNGNYFLQSCRRKEVLIERIGQLEDNYQNQIIDQLGDQIELISSVDSKQFVIQNQIVLNNSQKIWSHLKELYQPQIQSYQSLLTLTLSHRAYWQENVMHQELMKNQKVLALSTFVKHEITYLALVGQLFSEEKKKGFLRIFQFDQYELETQQEFLLAKEVLDVKLMSENIALIITEESVVAVQFSEQDVYFNKLKVVFNVVDERIAPAALEVHENQKEFFIYDIKKSISLYRYCCSSKPEKILYQVLEGINSIIKYYGPYILRTTSDRKIRLYGQIQKKKGEYLQIIGFGEMFDNITSIIVEPLRILVGSKEGNVISMIELTGKERKILESLQKVRLGGLIEDTSSGVKEQKEEEEKEKETELSKFLKQKEFEVSNIFADYEIINYFQSLSEYAQQLVLKQLAISEQEMQYFVASLVDRLL